jgi:hypothetical protein
VQLPGIFLGGLVFNEKNASRFAAECDRLSPKLAAKLRNE